MILIYTHTITARVAYAIDLVFNSVLNYPYQLTDNLQNYHSSPLPKLAYTNSSNGFDVFIEANDLLFEENIRTELPEASGEYLNFPCLFKTSGHSFLPYDIFATVFYFAVRYEEYLPYKPDKHQRFQAEESIAFKAGFLDKPFLNYLIEDFAKKLRQQFPGLEFKKRTFNFLSTIDIDNALAYAHKGFKRNAGGLIKDLASFKFKAVKERIKSNVNDSKDPYNTFSLINAISKETQTELKYFVLIGDHSDYDKNPHYQNRGFRTLLKSLPCNESIGLHPSYESFTGPEKTGIEKKRLEEIIEKKVTSARCHFLRIAFPGRYREFIKEGITDDYTMIYASQSGFRTGLCIPYKWFDLQKNEVTGLTVHTSVIMEGTLRDYNKLSVDKATEISLKLLQEVKQFGGEFISIFHNDSFVPEQKQWISFYKMILNQSKINNTQLPTTNHQ